jgi:NitT/TauT family transport system substrate-binding protein
MIFFKKWKMKNIVILLTLVLLSQCNPPKDPIRIGVNAWPPCEIWYVAQKMGYFGDTKVELVRFSAWTDNMLSLYTGKTDITHATYFNALYYSQKGEQGQIILTSDTILGGDGLVVKGAIKSGADLKNKKIAVEVGTDEHFLLFKTLELYGLSVADVQIIPSTSMEAMNKFIKGEVDACYTYEPFLSQAATEGSGKVLSTTKDLPGYMIDVLVGRSSVMQKRKKEYQTIVKAWYKAQQYIREHPAEAMAIMAPLEKMEIADYKGFFNGFTFYSLVENKELMASQKLKSILSEISDFIQKTNLNPNKIDVNSVYTNEIIKDL